MSPRSDARARARRRPALLAAALAVPALLVPASAQAQTGGAAAEPAPAAAALTLKVQKRHVLLGRRTVVSGRVSSGTRGLPVRIQRRVRGGWRTVARTRTGTDGRFRKAYRPRGLGSRRVRARLVATASASATPRTRGRLLTVYRRGHASWYGPGLYGNRLACGGRLSTRTLGVAHKSLPCGTKVKFRYRGRSVTVRVVDRGPYIAGRTWDLTARTKRALRFPSTGTVWASR